MAKSEKIENKDQKTEKPTKKINKCRPGIPSGPTPPRSAWEIPFSFFPLQISEDGRTRLHDLHRFTRKYHC